MAALVAFSLLISAIGAFAWELIEVEEDLISEPIPMPLQESFAAVAKAPTPENTPPLNFTPPSPTGEADPNAGAVVAAGEVVPESGRVASSYFDDAVFIGDSLTTGIQLYDVMSNTTVLAATGLNPQSIHTKDVITVDDVSYTAMSYIEAFKPAKIYVMIGANSLTQMPDDWMEENFDSMLAEIKLKSPNSTIYLQSLTPINDAVYGGGPTGNMNNAKIMEFNEVLKNLAKKHGIYYLDLYTGLVNEDGQLSEEDTPDGLHFNSKVYTRWFDYLKTHTVKLQ